MITIWWIAAYLFAGYCLFDPQDWGRP